MHDKYPWIKACDGSNPDHPSGFLCERCGAEDVLPKRTPLYEWLFMAGKFLDRHRECKEKATK